MAVKPVVYDDTTNKHRPLGSGERMDGLSASSIISADSGNLITTGSDGLVYVTGSGIADPAADNLLEATSAGKLKVDMDRIIGWLGGHPSDAKDFAEAVNVVSGDSGNLIREGTDGGAYASSAELADGLTVVPNSAGKLSVGDISGVAVAASGASAARALGDRFGDVANVKDYGALADGETDNTAAVQAALASAAGTGRTLWIPKGCLYDRGAVAVPEAVLVIDDSTGVRVTSGDFWWRPNVSGVKVVMHRGWCGGAPENTVLAFNFAAQMKPFGIETDVRWTSDGAMVLMHDATVDRTTDGTGYVASKTLAQIRALSADKVNGASLGLSGILVPTLEEFLEVCRNFGIHPFLHIIDGATASQIGQMMDAVADFQFDEMAFVMAGSLEELAMVRAKSKRTALIRGIADPDAAFFKAFSHLGGKLYWGYTYDSMTAAQIAMSRSYGIDVYAYTATGRPSFDEMADLGISLRYCNENM